MPEQREHREFAANSFQFEGVERTNVPLETPSFVRPPSESTGVDLRLGAFLAEVTARRQRRAETRRQFAAARTAGLRARHATKTRPLKPPHSQEPAPPDPPRTT